MKGISPRFFELDGLHGLLRGWFSVFCRWRDSRDFSNWGAVHHVMARGVGGKQLFNAKEDHESFLYWLEKVSGVSESAGINRLGNENERVLQRKPSQ